MAADLAERGKYEAAWKVVGKLLMDDPMNPRALVTGSYVMRAMGGYQQAFHFARAATQIIPNDAAAWTNYGHAQSIMYLVKDAEKSYMRGLELSKTDFDRKVLWVNLSALYIDSGRFTDAMAYIRKVLEVDPNHKDAKANLGFCQLATRNWAEGWKGYRNTIGTDWRPMTQYNQEPEWDGTPGKVVALYGDQGLGDEVSFASMLPDAIKACKKVIVDCDQRLEGLFRRSFPKAKIYGTRTSKDGQWAKEDWNIDASLPLGQIGEYYRTDASHFPGDAYLVPCPNRLAMWRALFKGKKKPVIGIAWTGGSPKTNSRNRRIALEDLLPIFRRVPGHYVSLQYKDAQKEIDAFKARHKWVDLEQYSYGTLTNDYDDTAAMIAACDFVVCIQTAVAHTAGALGVPVYVLVPTATQWRYGESTETIPWYKSLRVVRQSTDGEWKDDIDRLSRRLQADHARVPAGAGDTARNDRVRDCLNPVRAHGVGHHQPDGRHASA